MRNQAEDVHLHLFNVIRRNFRKCNSVQNWNNGKCRCICKNKTKKTCVLKRFYLEP